MRLIAGVTSNGKTTNCTRRSRVVLTLCLAICCTNYNNGNESLDELDEVVCDLLTSLTNCSLGNGLNYN